MPTPTYDAVMAEVQTSVADVLADYGDADVNPDDVFHDVLLSILHAVPADLAAEVWRTQVGGPLPTRDVALGAR